MDLFFDIVRTTIPALIVFFTVYFLIREYNNSQAKIAHIKIQESIARKEVNPSKIAAYERLALFCERIKINKLIVRLRSSEVTVESLQNAMISAVRQEYDHNVTQQIYISHKLWEIITIAKNETISIIRDASVNTENDKTDTFIDNLFNEMKKRGTDPLEKALYAIREEVKSIL